MSPACPLHPHPALPVTSVLVKPKYSQTAAIHPDLDKAESGWPRLSPHGIRSLFPFPGFALLGPRNGMLEFLDFTSHTLFSLFASLGVMRVPTVTSCTALWLLMLVSGSWGKSCFSLLIPASAWEARLEVAQASSLTLHSRTSETIFCHVTEGTRPSLGLRCLLQFAQAGLKILPVPRAWVPRGRPWRSLEKFLGSVICDPEPCFSGAVESGRSSGQFHSSVLSTSCVMLCT